MIQTINKVVYKAFGLSISSEIKMPELIKTVNPDEQVNVFIQITDLTDLWNKSIMQGEIYVVRENLFMFQVPETAIFAIQNGDTIHVSPMIGADESQIRLFILGTCMGALLMQRKILPLHGSAIAIGGKAYAFVGTSGAGKSTLASAFISKGYELLSDDVIAVTFSEAQVPMVMPSYPQQKLWQESLMEFGMETSSYQPIFQRETKFLVPVSNQFLTDPLPLAGVFELSNMASEKVEIQTIEGLARLSTLFRQTFRSSLLERLQLMEWHFETTVKILNNIDIFQLRRPTAGFTAPHMVSLILKTLQRGE
ncbi:aldolase [Paenibacillus sp. 2RAB27]|uniref:aldolase n=1 Tax=Paenibacillus sp. 2RAB27 TaxID=3232991 RepID=UPI003F9CED15